MKLRAILFIAAISIDANAQGCQQRPYYAPEGAGTVEAGNGYGPGLGLNFERAQFKMLRLAIAAPPEPKDIDLVLSWRANEPAIVKVPVKINYRTCGESTTSEVEFKLMGRFARARIPGQPTCLEVELPVLDVNGDLVQLGTAIFRRRTAEFCSSSF